MAIPDAIIDEIRNRTDIAEVARAFHLELKKGGANDFKACCPFHQERTPSFHINTSRQFYHCFGCGKGGDAIRLVQELTNTDFLGAIRWLGNFYHIAVPEEEDSRDPHWQEKHKRGELGRRLLEEVAGFFQSSLTSPQGKAAREYLRRERGLDQETLQKYRIGFAPDGWNEACAWALSQGFSRDLIQETGIGYPSHKDPNSLLDRWRNRIIFPICDDLSRVVGFSGRLFTQTPGRANEGKYVNSPESDFFHKSKLLYGFHLAKSSFHNAGRAVICEGQLDVIACHRAGVGEALAAQGTAFTEDHARMLARTKVPQVHLAFDGDAAGLHAIERTLPLLLAQNLGVQVIRLPPGEDPDSLFRHGGADALRKVMAAFQPAIPYYFSQLIQETPPETPEAKSKIVTRMLGLLATIPDQVTRYEYGQKLAGDLGLPPKLVDDQLNRLIQQEAERKERLQTMGSPRSPAPGAVPPGILPDAPPQEENLAVLFHDHQGITALAKIMLDLCVNFQPVAEAWANLDLGKAMSVENPVVRALNLLLAGTAEGDWEGARKLLLQGELGTTPEVGAVLACSSFEKETLDAEGNLSPLLQQVMKDCQQRLDYQNLAQRRRELSQRLQTATDPETIRNLLRESQEVAKAIALYKRKS
ncbi:MAG: DNA primase [Oligosphaeraceae bacterium]